MISRMSQTALSVRRSGIREFSALAAAPGVINLTLGEPCFDTAQPPKAAASAAIAAGENRYIPAGGTMELRQAIAEAEQRDRGLVYAPEEVLVTAGATEGLFVALFSLLEPGDEVIVPYPAFLLYREIIELCRGIAVPLPTADRQFQIDRAVLAACLSPRTKAILLNSPHNPTGTVYRRESLQAVLAAVADRPIFVLCDDVYSRFIYDPPDAAGRTAKTEMSTTGFPSLAIAAGLRSQLLVVNSFSKTYAMPGWRMGWLMADRRITERLSLVHQYMVTSTPAPFQRACICALGLPCETTRLFYQARRDQLHAGLCELHLQAPLPEGGFYAFPEITGTGMDDVTFCRRLATEGGVAAVPGSCFGQAGHVRLSFCVEEAKLNEALRRLSAFLYHQK